MLQTLSFKNLFSSVAQSCPTLCDPMNRSTPGRPIHHKLVPNDLKIPPLSLLAEIGFIFSYSPISATYVSVTRRQGLSWRNKDLGESLFAWPEQNCQARWHEWFPPSALSPEEPSVLCWDHLCPIPGAAPKMPSGHVLTLSFHLCHPGTVLFSL